MNRRNAAPVVVLELQRSLLEGVHGLAEVGGLAVEQCRESLALERAEHISACLAVSAEAVPGLEMHIRYRVQS